MFKKEFDSSYVGFMKDGAQWLVDNTDIKLVGKYLIYVFTTLQTFFFFSFFLANYHPFHVYIRKGMGKIGLCFWY